MERDFFIVKKCPEFGLKMTVKKRAFLWRNALELH
jgi:hypothetical protein